MVRLIRILIILIFFPAVLSAVAGWYGAAGFLQPQKRVHATYGGYKIKYICTVK